MSAILTATYRRMGGATFDFDRYGRHLDLVRRRWQGTGLTNVEAYRGTAALGGGDAPVVATAVLRFESAAALEAALGGEHFAEVAADIASFTDIVPELQINVPLS